MKYLKLLLVMAALSTFFVACEDSAPFEYQEQRYVEGYLIVDKPIGPIGVLKTMPMDQKYDRTKAHIKDAIVTISVDDKEYQLEFVDEPGKDLGYYLRDESVIVEPMKRYNLKVVDGDNTYTGTTFTPTRIGWTLPPRPQLQFPLDTVNLPGNPDYDLAWEKEDKSDKNNFYLLMVKPLDTLNYGTYLNPPTQEMNRRNYHPFFNSGDGGEDENEDENYYELTTLNLIANDATPTVWLAFKWFGKQDIQVFLADANMLKWFIMTWQQSTYDPNFGSIENGMGCFGSASVISGETFLLKNQP
jgi:hypothetical protein